MDYTNTDFWIAIGVGGTIIGSASLAQQLLNKNNSDPYSGIKGKSVLRDFFLGAFLTALLYMFLPESFQSWISSGKSAVESITPSLPKSVSEYDLQIGPARF
jgi:hypothetical protein